MPVTLTAKQQHEYELLSRKKFKPALLGTCAGCAVPIPVGYLIHVTKWERIDKGGGYVVQEPREMWCKNCIVAGKSVPLPTHHRHHHVAPPVQSVPARTPAAPDKIKQLARLLLGACTSQSQTRLDIADAAGVQDYDMALRILEKLVAVGKLRSEKGRYSRV